MAPPKKYPKSVRRKDALRTIAREHAYVTSTKPRSYWDDSCHVIWGSQDHYDVLEQVGKGKYGEVFLGVEVCTNREVVIKIMRPVKEQRLRREIKILQLMSGGPNIIKLLEVVRDADTKTPSFIFEPVKAWNLKQLHGSLTDNDIRYYIFQLLRALEFCHSKGVMHRDVKPANVLIDHDTRQLRLIDWGLADFYHPGKEYPVRVATRFYKGPELLVDIRDYDYSLDLWAVGCMLASLLFKKAVFFRGEDEYDQLVKIVRVLGTDALYEYLEKYGIDLDPKLAQLCGYKPKVAWRKFVNADNQHLVTPEALNLLDSLLQYDHQARLTAREAMEHEYFDAVKDSLALSTPPEPALVACR